MSAMMSFIENMEQYQLVAENHHHATKCLSQIQMTLINSSNSEIFF